MYDNFSTDALRMPSTEDIGLIKKSVREFKANAKAKLIEHIIQTIVGAMVLFVFITTLSKCTVAAFNVLMWVAFAFIVGYWIVDAIMRYRNSQNSIEQLNSGEFKIARCKANECEVAKWRCVVDGHAENDTNGSSIQFTIGNRFVEAENFDRTFLCAVTENYAFVVARMPDGECLVSDDVAVFKQCN